MKTLQLFMSDVNLDNNNILVIGQGVLSNEIMETNHNFYIMTEEKIDNPFENLHQIITI